MQGVLIFIQLLLAEGQEQNSDLTKVYIIFIQKSTFFIQPRVFPKSGPVRRVARERQISDLQQDLVPGTFACKCGTLKWPAIFPELTLKGSPGNAGDRTPHRLVNGDFLFVLAERFNNAHFPRIGVSPFTFLRSWA